MPSAVFRRVAPLLLAALLCAGCVEDLKAIPRPEDNQTFGEKFFAIMCGRVAYASELANQRAGAVGDYTDVAGDRYRRACQAGEAKYLPRDVAKTAPKVLALVQQRAALVRAVDAVFPAKGLDDVQQFLLDVLPLTDRDLMPAMVDSAAALVKKVLEPDTALQAALAALEPRQGYRPAAVAGGLLGEVTAYPGLYGALDTLLGFAADGGKGHGPLLSLLDALAFELRAAQAVDDTTRTSPTKPGAADRTLRLALDFVLKDQTLAGAASAPILLVQRDWRGVAQVLADTSGALPAPFVDKDGDKLADLDAAGALATATGAAAPLPFVQDPAAADTAAKRDSLGRATDAAGAPLFRYLDLDTTILGAVARKDVMDVLDYRTDLGFKLLMGSTLFLGQRKTLTKKGNNETLSYAGFDTSKSALLDLAHGALQAARAPGVDSLLETADLLLAKHEGRLTRLLEAVMDMMDLGDKYPAAQLADKSNLFDDLLPVLVKIVNKKKTGAKTALLEDLIHALTDPRTRYLGRMLAPYMINRDVHVLSAKLDQVLNSDGTAATFVTPVDRTKSDSGLNRSIFQRVLHLMKNVSGLRLGSKANAQIEIGGTKVGSPLYRYELFDIKDSAELFIQTMAFTRDSAGKLTTVRKGQLPMDLSSVQNMMTWLQTNYGITKDNFLEKLSGINGLTTRPTPEALVKLLFAPKLPDEMLSLMDPPTDAGGKVLATKYKGSAVSWLLPHPTLGCRNSKGLPCTVFDAMSPVVQAFADHDAEDLFVELLTTLHDHWPSSNSLDHQVVLPAAAEFVWGSQALTWEPYIAGILTTTDVMDALDALAPVLDTLSLADGTLAKSRLVSSLAFLIDPAASPGLKYRDGGATVYKSDGVTKVTCGSAPACVTPFYLLLDALGDLSDLLDAAKKGADKDLADDWDDALTGVVDRFLAIEGTGVNVRLKKRHMIPIAREGIKLLRARLKAHGVAGDLVAWLSSDLPGSLADLLGSPVVPRAVDFLKVVRADDQVRLAIFGLLQHLLNFEGAPATYRATLTALADLAQVLLDDENLVPLLHAAGKALDSREGLLKASLAFLRPATTWDKNRVLIKLMGAALRVGSGGVTPAGSLIDVALAVHRKAPGSTAPLAGADVGLVLGETRDFLENKDTGLKKFFSLIKQRCGGQPCTKPAAEAGAGAPDGGAEAGTSELGAPELGPTPDGPAGLAADAGQG